MKGLKLIGKGSFTKAYLDENENVILHSTCPIKECMSMGWFPDSPLFPTIESTDKYEIYKMKYYPEVLSLKNTLDADQYLIYKQLRALECEQSQNTNDSLMNWCKAFETLENEELSETMVDAISACANYGSDIGFEISPRNVAVKNGKLILLDVFFSISTLNRVRSN